jgi:hypothetical protein
MRAKWFFGALTLGLVAGLGVVRPASAQDRAVHLFVRGGGFNGLRDLNESGTADFKRTGYDVGGGVGVDLHRYVALRADFAYARNELRQSGLGTGSDLNRFFWDGGVQLQYPAESGLKPYVFVGGGGVTLHPIGTSGVDRTKPAGTAGLGVSYEIPGSNFGVLFEGKGWVYEMSDLNGDLAGFDRTQFDVTWNAGFTYRMPFGSKTTLAQASR